MNNKARFFFFGGGGERENCGLLVLFRGCSRQIEYICVVLLESVSGLHFLPGYKTPYAEVIPREADMASILMRPAGFSG